MGFATPRAVRVFIVEDEVFVAEMLADMLAGEGYEVTWAENGRLALEKIDDRRYDLILSDLPTVGGVSGTSGPA